MAAQDNTRPLQTCELRAMFCEHGLLDKADGSSKFAQGDTQVMAAAYGPVEVKLNKELIDRATLEVIFRPKIGIPGCSEKLVEGIIRNSCEPIVLTALHPRASLTIVVQVVQNSGSLLSCAVNAACLAMMDAGFPMRCMMCGITCAITEQDELVLDPTLEQERKATAVLTFVFDSVNQNLLTSSTKGSFDVDQYNKCLAASKAAMGNILAFYRQSVERKLSKVSEALILLSFT
ncbi:predicted protein [Nematostella vectensis]|uniref:Exosome complex component RRP46 n=1 Tax=Nematostella vectensis TaxID=45351 RepID=A7RZV7_NEMVE|nr:predicted protein [Nematostella vectensis]|eukprot:XP_001635076.1 predicted protein [Nematostella vectensis]